MRNTRYISLLVAAVILSGCATLQIDGAGELLPVWTTQGGSLRHTNAVETPLRPPLVEVWDFNAGAGFGHLSPLIAGDVIFVGTRKGEVHAIDIHTGARLGQTSFGESIEGTPVFQDGILYVPVAWGSRAVYAYDVRRGATKWKQGGDAVNAGLIVDRDGLIVADVAGTVRELSLADGEVRWTADIDERAGVQAAPVLAGNRLIVGDDGGGVTALDASDGSRIWSTDAGGPIYSSPAANDRLVFIPTTRGTLDALDLETGKVKWSFEVSSPEVYIAAPAVGEWEVVFGASDGIVRSVDPADGSLIWRSDVGAAVTAAPLITDNTIYVGTMRSKFVGLARGDGTQTWETELDGRVKSAFAVKGTQIVVLAEPRLVYLFESSQDSYAIRDE